MKFLLAVLLVLVAGLAVNAAPSRRQVSNYYQYFSYTNKRNAIRYDNAYVTYNDALEVKHFSTELM